MEDYIHVFTMLIIGVHVCLSSVTVDPNSCGINECCPDYTLEGDQCIECPSGRYGHNCSKHCGDGFYGRKCKTKCPLDCNKTCDIASGLCPGPSSDNSTTVNTKGYQTKNNFREKLADFVNENMWMIIGVSSIFVSISCVGALLFWKICKSKREAFTRTFHTSDQSSEQLNGLRYESDGIFSNTSSTLQLPPRVHENNSSGGENAAPRPECEYSKSKKRYSLVRKITISREMTSHSEYSDDNDDMFDSDEFDDSFDVCKTVQISDLPKKDSFKMFQSERIKSNEAYGKVWL